MHDRDTEPQPSDIAAAARREAISAGQKLSGEIREITRALDFDLEPSSFLVALEDLAEKSRDVEDDR
ncbi:MAG: hypothetical protein H6851_04410 [Geminicoccaceae bacterium]|nr:hypothetical protein [Geminicoccaceae bacterium]MCB9942845.1 hypothetical protein [Geminicoccaceae bacterium]